MPENRLLSILNELKKTNGSVGVTARLCEVSAEVLKVDGAGIMLMSGDVRRGSVCSTNEVSALIEDLQYTLGEGPCVDAYDQGFPVAEPDLEAPTVARWPAFAPPVLEAGVRAIFGFPLQLGAIRLGALNVYTYRAGSLSGDQHADALAMAGIAARSVLSMQANAAGGELGTELETGADLRLVVHQATGMVSVQLDVSIAEALMRLRAFAFANGLRLAEVAEDVVARRLRIS